MTSCKFQTQVGGFSVIMLDIMDGTITVLTDGPKLVKKIGLIRNVALGDNRITGFARALGTETFELTVREDQRTIEKMKAIFVVFVDNLVAALAAQPETVAEINGRVIVPAPDAIIYEMMADR